MQSFDFTLQVGQVAVVDQHVVGVLQALVAPGLGLEDRSNNPDLSAIRRIQMTQPWILGLTGGIGSGKSAAAEHFISLGVHLVDADHAARWVVEPGRPALAKIVERFGDGILLPDGQLDRAALRERIFQAPEERRWLEQLLHPLIGAEIDPGSVRASGCPRARLEVP